MKRLYLRIYFAVLASIALSIVLAGATWRLVGDPDRFAPDPALLSAMATGLAPPRDAPVAQQVAALERWRALSGFSLALRDKSGAVTASVGERPGSAETFFGRMRERRGSFVVPLEDGRTLLALRPPPEHMPLRGLGWLLALVAIGFAVAICAWPVVRRLTRDLEALERTVAALGQGDLSARAPVRGSDEVARLATTFNHAAARIAELMRANRTLLANASHELRSPLARLRMSVETLGPSAPPGTRAEIERNVRELDQLIDEILLASRLDAGAVEAPAREDVDLVALAAEECARTGADLEAGVDLTLSGDPRLLRRALRNLLENAARHGSADAETSVRRVGAVLRVEVCDRGPGVPESERERIFEPFHRLAGASESDGGVGLGLSLARRIAQLHGGSLVCLARDGGGACFRMDLPA
jgi:signal transduction histidine kinase